MAEEVWNSQEKILTKEQVHTVLEFSDALYQLGRYGQFYNPQSSNTLLRGLSGSKAAPTLEKIKKALGECRENPTEINSYMEFMKAYDMIFSKIVK